MISDKIKEKKVNKGMLLLFVGLLICALLPDELNFLSYRSENKTNYLFIYTVATSIKKLRGKIVL